MIRFWYEGQETRVVSRGHQWYMTGDAGDLPPKQSVRALLWNELWVPFGATGTQTWACDMPIGVKSGRGTLVATRMSLGRRSFGEISFDTTAPRNVRPYIYNYQTFDPVRGPTRVGAILAGKELELLISSGLTDPAEFVPVREPVLVVWSGWELPVVSRRSPMNVRVRVPARVPAGLACVCLIRGSGEKYWGPPLFVAAAEAPGDAALRSEPPDVAGPPRRGWWRRLWSMKSPKEGQ